MRYRIGESPETSSWGSTDEMLLLTVALSLLIGIGLTWLGIRGNQLWMAVWCGGLVLCSLVYLGWEVYRRI